MVKDYEVEEFVEYLKTLPAHLPISDQYDSIYGQKRAWWVIEGLSQREHMVCWFSQQRTKGNKNFSRITPNGSAKKTYSRLGCSGALLWIAEALGENVEILKNAANAACKETNESRRCGLIRNIIPWSSIVALYERGKDSNE